MASSLETWDAFFSDFYLRAFAGTPGETEAHEQACAAVRLAGCADGADVLDVPCGFGRHAIPLADAGYRVVGVDRSQTLLDAARARSRPHRWPKLMQADYRLLPFPDASFDAALNLFTSLGYLGDEQDAVALSEIRRVLRPGAQLVIELMHRDRLVSGFREHDWRLVGEGRLLLEQRTFEPASGIAQTTVTLIESGGDRESRTFSIRVYTATELVAMLAAAGYETARCYGDFDGGAFTTATRLVVVARR
jgi:SAM-dependent methyltransferase